MDAKEQPDSIPQVGGDSQSQSILLSAGRLESQLAFKPEQIRTVANNIVAWSVDNILAIVDSTTSIKIIHISLPNRSQIIPIQEKPYILRFSPRGDALFAAFRSSKTCSLWVRIGKTLNVWKLKQSWNGWQGKVLDLQWLGVHRAWVSKPELHRRPAKGPQFAAEQAIQAVGAVIVCESGQIILFHGSVEDGADWDTQMIQVPIPSQERVAKAAIGLVPDESTALLAFTLRMSSKATLPGLKAEGDALGMFFESADEVITQDDQNIPNHLDDGQDKIELMEIRLDLASLPSAITLRPLSPLYMSSYENPSFPFASTITRLMWVDADRREGTLGTGAKLKLFGSFYSKNATTMRTWEVQREEVEVLSEAFAKLEAAKSKVDDEEKEDWIAKSSHHQTYADYIIHHYQIIPASDRIMCSWIHSPEKDVLSSVSKPRMEYKLVDTNSLQIVEGIAMSTSQNNSCEPALSPSGSLAAQIVNQKVNIVRTSKAVRWSEDDALVYWPAVSQGRNIDDLIRVCSFDLEAIATAFQVNESKFHEIIAMIRLSAQTNQIESISLAKNSRILLDLVDCFSKLNGSDKGSHFDQSKLWSLLSTLEWLVELMESLARQAYVHHATNSISSPAPSKATTEIEKSIHKDEPDLLALFSHRLARRVLIRTIITSVKFCNWLARINRSKEQVKELMRNEEVREAIKANNNIDSSNPGQRDGNVLWSLADNLRLAQMRVSEILLKSAVDLSQLGRLLKSYKGGEEDAASSSSSPKWWTALDTGDRAKMAKTIVEGQCIKMALSLFCPREGDDGRDIQKRDILTKATLQAKAKHFLCLACQGQTQVHLSMDQSCLCGSNAWWSVV